MIALLAVAAHLQKAPADIPVPARSYVLTLQQALALGYRGNLQLEASRQDATGAQAQLGKAQAAYYPTLSGSVGIQNQANSPGPAPTTTGLAPGLTVSYDLGTDGSRRYQVRQAADSAELARLATDVARDQVTLSVTNAYYDLQRDQAQVRIEETAVDNARAGLDAAQAMFAAGMGTKFDSERAQTQLAAAQQALVSARANVVVAKGNLALQLGLPLDAAVQAIDPLTPAGTWSYSLAETGTRALANQPDIAQAKLKQDLANLDLDLAYAQRIPHTSLLATVAGSQALWAGSQPVPSMLGHLGFQTTIGLSTSFPLFDGTTVNAGVAQSRAEIAAAADRERGAALNVRFEVEQAYQQLQSSFANIQTSAVALRTSKDAVNAALERFRSGVGTQTDVIDAENDYTNAQASNFGAIVSYDKALAQLRVLTESSP